MKINITKEESIILYFDIFGISEIRKDKKLVYKLLRMWKWINTNIIINSPNINKKCYFFSDGGFIVYSIKKSDDNEIKRDIVATCFSDGINLMDMFLNNDFFLRGAISCGTIYFSEKVIVGDPIVRAVRLESEKCPGPFIIIPIRDMQLFLPENILFTIIPDSVILSTKDNKEKIEVFILRPGNFYKYFDKIKDRAEYFTRYGPYNYGKFWHDAYLYLLSTFDIDTGDLK
jgi:hypothetical protein